MRVSLLSTYHLILDKKWVTHTCKAPLLQSASPPLYLTQCYIIRHHLISSSRHYNVHFMALPPSWVPILSDGHFHHPAEYHPSCTGRAVSFVTKKDGMRLCVYVHECYFLFKRSISSFCFPINNTNSGKVALLILLGVPPLYILLIDMSRVRLGWETHQAGPSMFSSDLYSHLMVEFVYRSDSVFPKMKPSGRILFS